MRARIEKPAEPARERVVLLMGHPLLWMGEPRGAVCATKGPRLAVELDAGPTGWRAGRPWCRVLERAPTPRRGSTWTSTGPDRAEPRGGVPGAVIEWFMDSLEHFLNIRIDDLQGAEIRRLLNEHLREMEGTAPPESRHALDLEGLRRPEITFWTIWDGVELAGCGALKELDQEHGEIKSMRTARTHQRRGVASSLLECIISEAKVRGYRRLSLETGSMAYFEPARRLYANSGFQPCGPFGSYVEDPNSVFMTQELL